MSKDAPDPRALEDWESAFQYPIPTVRAAEKRLHQILNENHDKLRNIVGASYRDLLGTAETIIDVDEKLKDIETFIGVTTKNTDSRIVQRVTKHIGQIQQELSQKDEPQLYRAALLSSFEEALVVASRFLRTSQSTLLPAKVLVVAKLLSQSISETTKARSKLSRHRAQTLGILRTKLSRKIDRRLKNCKSSQAEIVEDLLAFCLSNRSSANDALTHFLFLRNDVACTTRRSGKISRDNVKASTFTRLDTYITTLHVCRRIFPALLSSALRTVAAGPLLQDASVRDIAELNLDMTERWFTADIRNFTPWVRHDDLSKEKVDDIVKRWGQSTLAATVRAIESDLETEDDFKSLCIMRREVLQMWLSNKQYAYGVNTAEVFERLRDTFVSRLKRIIDLRFKSLQHSLLATALHSVRNEEDTENGDLRNLWDPSIVGLSYQHGALRLKDAVITGRHGRDPRISALLKTFRTHAKPIESINNTVSNLARLRWDEELEHDGYDDTNNDTLGIEETKSVVQIQDIERKLSKEDPDDLHVHLRDAVRSSTKKLEKELAESLATQSLPCKNASDTGLFILRLIRELRGLFPPLLRSLDANMEGEEPICAELHNSLTMSLIDTVVKHSSAALNENYQKQTASPINFRLLWDSGSPQVPQQPSPASFRFLQNTIRAMGSLGPDLWNADTVSRLKGKLTNAAADAIAASIKALPKSTVNSEDDPSSDNESGKETSGDDDNIRDLNSRKSFQATEDKVVQYLFDTAYISMACGLSNREQSHGLAITELVESLVRNSGLVDAPTVVQRIKKSAFEYWSRTCLLFGLLAENQPH